MARHLKMLQNTKYFQSLDPEVKTGILPSVFFMQQGEKEPQTGSFGEIAFWADGAANTKVKKWKGSRGGREESVGFEFGYFSKGNKM